MIDNGDDHDECTIEEEEQERLMLVELPPKKPEQEKIIDGVDADTGGQLQSSCTFVAPCASFGPLSSSSWRLWVYTT